MQNPTVSIIVPYYNVSEYFQPCLDSIIKATQGIPSEIILVNDGSDDDSFEIANSYASQYENIFNHNIEHGGVSAARNYGVAQAKGKYISFIDSDDLVIDSYYRDMLYMAEKYETPITTCNVTKVSSKGAGVVSAQYQFAFNGEGEPQPITSISRNNSLMYDASPCNKLILREFWIEKGLSFPEGRTYEDLVAILKMYLSAEKVAILHSFGYYWIMRDKGGGSITQNLTSEESIKNRMLACDDCLEMTKANPGLLKEMQKRVVKWDFEPYIEVFHEMAKEDRERITAQIAEYFEEKIPPETIELLQQYHVRKYQYIKEQDLRGIESISNHKRLAWSNALAERHGKIYEIKLPEEIYGMKYVGARRELQDHIPITSLTKMTAEDTIFSFETAIYHPRINMETENSLEAEAYLYNEHTGAKIRLDTKIINNSNVSLPHENVYSQDDYCVYHYNYEWCWTRCSIDLKRLLLEDKECLDMVNSEDSPTPRWLLFYKYKTPISEGHRPLRGISPAIRKIIDNSKTIIDIDGQNYRITPKYDLRQSFFIEITKEEEIEGKNS